MKEGSFRRIVVANKTPIVVDPNRFRVTETVINGRHPGQSIKAFEIIPVTGHHIHENPKPTNHKIELRERKRKEFDKNPNHQRDKKRRESMRRHQR